MTPEQALRLLREVLTNDSVSMNCKTWVAVDRAFEVLQGTMTKKDPMDKKTPKKTPKKKSGKNA